MNKKLLLLTSAAVLAFPGIASAHPGHAVEGGSGLINGLLHPLTGIDHMLALVAVALLAARLGGRAVLAVPIGFLASGAVGALTAAYGLQLPLVELMIVASVLTFGVLLARRHAAPKVLVAMACLFGLFHGFAHLSAIGGHDSVAAYTSGLAFASSLIIAMSLGCGMLIQRYRSQDQLVSLWRYLGGSFAIAAVALLLV